MYALGGRADTGDRRHRALPVAPPLLPGAALHKRMPHTSRRIASGRCTVQERVSLRLRPLAQPPYVEAPFSGGVPSAAIAATISAFVYCIACNAPASLISSTSRNASPSCSSTLSTLSRRERISISALPTGTSYPSFRPSRFRPLTTANHLASGRMLRKFWRAALRWWRWQEKPSSDTHQQTQGSPELGEPPNGDRTT
jgi:hypothetical protein